MRSFALCAAFAALSLTQPIAAHAQNTPILTCNAASTTPEVVKDPTTVFTTKAPNKTLWTVGAVAGAGGQSAVAPAAVPAGLTWHAITGTELDTAPAPTPDAIGLLAATAGNPNTNANVMFYFKYTFEMDPAATPADFGMTFLITRPDDFLKGVYVNGQLFPFNVTLGQTTTISLPTGWQAGTNDVYFAVYSTSPAAIRLQATAPTVTSCAAPPPTIAITQPPAQTTSTTPSYTGTIQNPGTATTVDVVVTDASDPTKIYTYLATITGNTYTIAGVPLAVGNYNIVATLTGTTVSATTTMPVTAAAVVDVAPVPSLGVLGLGLLGAALGALGVRRRQRAA